jgi:hypothetical protein
MPSLRTDPRAGKRQTHRSRRCVYCGRPLTYPQAAIYPGTCAEHADLPELDPNYQASLRVALP